MTGKADYTEEEWKLLREAPTSAGMLVIEADRGGAIRETFSMAKAYTEARKQHGGSQLLDDIASEKPEVDRTRFQSVEDLRSTLLQHIRDAVTLLSEKATPEELDDYRRFLASVASRVAEARREGFLGMSGERVSEAEQRALAEIAEAAGTTTEPGAG
jgi:alkylhydroperoxidase/carboxymuconolactone decarboxylase family protein YurZ